MKKFGLKFVLALSMCLVLVFGVTACASQQSSEQKNYDSKYQYISDFEKLGLGMFVHFGLYSEVGKGEWYLHENPEANMEDYEKLTQTFDVDAN